MIFTHQVPTFVAGQEQSHLSQMVTIHFTHREKEIILIPQRLKNGLLLTLEGDLGKNDSRMEHSLRISSRDSEGAQTNMEYKNFPVSCVWRRSGELHKEGKPYQGERQTMT